MKKQFKVDHNTAVVEYFMKKQIIVALWDAYFFDWHEYFIIDTMWILYIVD